MNQFLQLIITGLYTGAIYALIALGYTMVYGIIELINFAHGDVFMIGTFITIVVLNVFGVSKSTAFPVVFAVLVLAFLLSVLICAVLNVVIERIAYRPLRNAPRLAPLISAIGVSLILEDLGKLWKGPDYVLFPDGVVNPVTYHVGSLSISNISLIVIITALVLMIGLHLLVTRTQIGRAMRAVAQDRDAAALMGINVDRIIAVTFFIGAALAGAAAFIYDLQYGVTRFDIGFQLGLIAFTAAVLGGIGNIVGAMLGGLLIGLIQAIVIIAIPDRDFPFGLPHGGVAWSQAVVFAILILILVFRPSGLLGQQTPEKV